MRATVTDKLVGIDKGITLFFGEVEREEGFIELDPISFIVVLELIEKLDIDGDELFYQVDAIEAGFFFLTQQQIGNGAEDYGFGRFAQHGGRGAGLGEQLGREEFEFLFYGELGYDV